MQRFLARLTQDLNLALSGLDRETEAQAQRAGAVAKATGGDGGVSDATKAALTEQAERLRSLIIKTADEVHAEYDELTRTLESSYIAKSEWGTYEEVIHQDIVETADAVVRKFDYDSRIESLAKDAAAFNEYRTESEGYIRQGIVGYNGTVPVIGIAIGQNLKVTAEIVTVDGVEYEVLEEGQAMGVYTATGLEFWQNGQKVAYLDNNRLKVADALSIGSWEISHKNGFTLAWVGD